MNPLEENQVGQSHGLSIRVGHGLHERIKEYADASGMSMSKLNRNLLEGAVDLLDQAKEDDGVVLTGHLEGIRRRIEITEAERSRNPTTPATSKGGGKVAEMEAKVDALEDKMDQILEALGKGGGS